MDDHKLVVVAETFGELSAQVLRSKLESAGIPVALQYDSYAVHIFPVPGTPLALVRVVVPDAFAEDARAILENDVDVDEDALAQDAMDSDEDDASV